MLPDTIVTWIIPNIVLFMSVLTKMGGKRNKNYINVLVNGQILPNNVAWCMTKTWMLGFIIKRENHNNQKGNIQDKDPSYTVGH
jgi:hypothetical protein